MSESPNGREPIAVVGMALRVPGAGSLHQFWQNILLAKDTLTRPSTDDLRAAGVSRRQLASVNFVRSEPLLTDIEYFDAPFFGMTGYEAERTEPSHRLFLECAWEAMEAGGVVPGQGDLVTGVFGGGEGSYRRENLRHLDAHAIEGAAQVPDRGKELPLHLGNGFGFFSTRVAHKLDLTGPSFTVLAACSTSLLALHLAVQSLRRGECDVAIAGGAGAMMPHVGGYISSVEGMESPTGRVRPFDADADGTIFGSGAGAVVLRPLAAAIADGSPIWAIVRGSGVSNDGDPEGKESFIAPSREGQIAAVEAAMADAAVDAQTIGYLEAHGTATLLGDPVEIAATAEVYRRFTSAKGYCALGSVKGNIGHLRTAAGVVSFIKACLALRHRALPPVANFSSHNPRIDFESSPFFLSTKPLPWTRPPHPRRAAISAFGFGGANAHVIIEEYRAASVESSSRRRHLLPLSAKSETALERRITDLAAYLDENPSSQMADVAHSLQCGREAMPYRICVCVDEHIETASMQLRQASMTADTRRFTKSPARPVVFLFPGQGAQRPAMGRDVYDREPLYRDIVDHCAQLLEGKLELDIRTLIHANADSSRNAGMLRQTANAQPALFVVGYALARLFMSWGVRPEAMLGHSIGELIAACLAGIFSLEDALTLVAARAQLMQACQPGAMAAVFLTEEQLREAVAGENVEIAALNAPNVGVVSGAELDVARFLEKMAKADVGTRRVETSHAFHSSMMDPALPAFRQVLQEIELQAPRIPVISNVTGTTLTDEDAQDPEYWSNHLRRTVMFSAGANNLLSDRDRLFLELGPGHTLCDLIRQHDPEADALAALDDINSTHTSGDGMHSALLTLGRLWSVGGTVDWRSFYGDEPRQKLTLPTYPFERRRYWIGPGEFETKEREDIFLYEPGWRLAELPPHLSWDNTRPWLIFQDEHGIGLAIARQLEAQGNTVTSVRPGAAFAEQSSSTITVRPDSRADLAAVLTKARTNDGGRAPQIIHLWSLTGESGEHNTVDAFRRSNRTGFYTLIALAQAAFDIGLNDEVDVMVVADGLRQIDGESTPLYAEKGALLGPIRNIAKEFPSMSFRCVDISGFENGHPVDDLCTAIVAEAMASDGRIVTCLRPSGRYVEELYPLAAPPVSRPRLRDGGTVLITGGMGGLGLKVASTLFETAHARLALASRWQVPPKQEWHARARSNDKIGRALRELVALEERGAEILIVSADTADVHAVKAAIAQTEARFGAINGVVHAAGINTDGPLISTTPEIAEPAFEAKVHGAFNLEEIFREVPLDFFVNFSSRSSYTPAPGQAIYTASNSVLDILSRRRSQTHPGLNCAIGWGAWQEIGMAALIAERRVRETKEAVRTEREHLVDRSIDHPLVKVRRRGGNGSTIYSNVMQDGDHWVCQHRFKGRALLAGVTILETLRASYIDLRDAVGSIELSQIAFIRPLFVDENGTEIEIEYAPDGDRHRFEVRSRPLASGGNWTVNTIGRAAPAEPSIADPVPVPDDIPTTGWRYGVSPGFAFGLRWDCMLGARVDGDVMWARTRLADDFVQDLNSFALHPATFDRALNAPSKAYGVLGVPYTLDRIVIHRGLDQEYFARSTRRTVGQSDCFDALFVDRDGNVLVETEGFIVRAVDGSSLAELSDVATGGTLFSSAALAANQRIAITQPGNLESLQPCEFEVQTPQADEVQIDVVAAGLNFRDVLTALGQLPMTSGSDTRFGGECSGIVAKIGADVVGVRPGDPVVALAANAFAGSVNVKSVLVMPVPRTIPMEDAAGIPTVFLTADYAINVLARLKKGERILIHAAAGGVGLAAVQIAQHIGAEIFATAGHPDKRQYLKKLGVEHVMDSRSLDFAVEIRNLTNGEGVDVILNSLAGEYIPASLALLRYKGRFLEIGKRDILSDAKIGLSPFQNNLAYHAIDLGPMIQRCDPMLVDLFDSLMLRFARGELTPIPTAVMPIGDVARAAQRMARGEHIGKIVLKVRDDPDPWRSVFRKFQELYGPGVPVAPGLATFRRLLSANQVPHYVMALGRKIEEIGQVEHRIGGRQNTRPDLSTEYAAPTNAEEESLVRIWENALGVSPIGINDDFFDLGGDSIIAVQTQFAVADRFGISLSTNIFFDYPTIAALAAHIQSSETREATTNRSRGARNPSHLSPHHAGEISIG